MVSMTTTAPTPPPAARSPRWTPLVGAGIRLRLLRRISLLSNLDYWTRNAAAIQRSQLRKLLTHAYRKAVPVADWYTFKDLIARMREGAEPDILWPGLIRDFAQTSGTTAGDKFIPVSKAMMKSNFLASLDIFANMARFGIPLTKVTAGRCLFLGGSSDCPTSDKGIRTGDLSGLVMPLIRWPISKIYSPGPEIALMSNWPAKIEAMAKSCIDQDIRMISGMPSWAIVLFERVIAEAKSRGRDASTIRDIWPNLQVFVHGGVKYTPFEPRVRQFWSGSPTGDDVPTRLELYPASEGFVAMQDARGDPGLRLNTDIGLFHEFIPLENAADPNPPAFTCDEVEKGQKYVVTLSTCAGLWRYILGDVVEFDSIPHTLSGRGARSAFGPPRLRIVGRHKHFINAFGENLIVEHIENAVAAASKQSGVMIGEFTAAPLYPKAGQRGAVELAIEIEGKPSESALQRFRDTFDAALKTQSVDYGVKRTSDLGMAPPLVTPLPVGAFHRWMQSRGKLGGQHKCPRCANSRDIIDAVIGAARA
jgi:hypothetical protein